MEDDLCGICLESNYDYECVNCGYKYCWKCLYKCITHATKMDAMCQNCENVLSINIIWKCFGKSKFRSEYLNSLYQSELDQEKQQISLLLPYCQKLKKIYDVEDKKLCNTYLNNLHDINLIPMSINKILATSDYRIKVTCMKDTLILNPSILDSISGGTSPHESLQLSEEIPKETTWKDLFEYHIPRLIIFINNCHSVFGVRKMPNNLDGMLHYIVEKILFDDLGNSKVKRETYRPDYLFRCQKLDCNGLIDTNYVCALCNTKFCKLCLAEEKEGHVCNEEEKKTHQDILNTTKPCPKCYTRIMRSEGCTQMFCTICHTGFDWVTGKIIKGNFHNPHRMEWLRTLGNEEATALTFANACDDPIIPYSACKCVLYDLYNAQVLHYRRYIRVLDRHLETQNNRFIILYELLKYVLKMDNDLESIIKRNTLIGIKTRYLRGIISRYIDSMNIIIQSIVQTFSEDLYDKIEHHEVMLIYANLLTEDNVSEKHKDTENNLKKRIKREMEIFHEITDSANEELLTYKRMFSLKVDRIIYDDRNPDWWKAQVGSKIMSEQRI